MFKVVSKMMSENVGKHLEVLTFIVAFLPFVLNALNLRATGKSDEGVPTHHLNHRALVPLVLV